MHIHICKHTTHTHTHTHTYIPRWLTGKESACQCRRHSFNPWIWKLPWRRKWQSTSVFLPKKNPMDGGAWQVTVHVVIQSWTRLSD